MRLSDTGRCFPSDLAEWIAEINARGNFNLSIMLQEQLLAYCHLLREWNQRLNLTSVIDDEGMAVRHILDSLVLLPWLDKISDRHKTISLADIGSGAGLPGLPLKIARPGLDVMLLDSLGKRVKFLQAVIDGLSLEGIEAVHARAEDAARDNMFREKFDLVTARAVAPLPVLAEYCLPFVRTGGIFIAMKGKLDAEIIAGSRAVGILGGKIEQIDEYKLPGTSMQRTLLIIVKTQPTPPVYPRPAGRPEKKPL